MFALNSPESHYVWIQSQTPQVGEGEQEKLCPSFSNVDYQNSEKKSGSWEVGCYCGGRPLVFNTKYGPSAVLSEFKGVFP